MIDLNLLQNKDTLENTIVKIGQELDPDILEWMLNKPDNGDYKQWEMCHHLVDNMLEWQAMRDRKIVGYKLLMGNDIELNSKIKEEIFSAGIKKGEEYQKMSDDIQNSKLH